MNKSFNGLIMYKSYETKRVILRDWLESDIEPYVTLNQDAEVLKYFPRLYSKEESIDDINEFKQQLVKYGYTIYACELKENHEFIGFVGLYNRFDMPFSPCTEIGWRINKNYWGKGLATEAAIKCLDIGFNECGLDQIVSFTAKINKASERVMQKIGMFHDVKDDFMHYKVSNDHPLSAHVLYRITKEQFSPIAKNVK